MNVNLYYPEYNDNLITFSLTSSVNSVNVFVFRGGQYETDTVAVDRLVSGFELATREINFRLELVADKVVDKAFIITCIRLPFLAKQLIAHPNFTRPVTAIYVQTSNETQVWHVLSVRRGREQNSLIGIKGVSITINGRELFAVKERIAMRGNVPAAFVSALAEQSTDDTRLTQLLYPHVKCVDEHVSIIKK